MPQAAPGRWACPSAILVATDLNDLDRLMPFAIEQAREYIRAAHSLHVLASSGRMAVDAVGMPYYDPSGGHRLCRKDSRALASDGSSEKCRPALLSCAKEILHTKSPMPFASSTQIAFFLGPGAGARSASCSSAPWQNKCCARSTSRSSPWGPRLISRWESNDREEVVLHATTLRETSSPSAALACQIASAQKRKLVLLHVLPPADEMAREGLPTGLDSTAMHELRILAAEIGAMEPDGGSPVETARLARQSCDRDSRGFSGSAMRA